MTKLRKPLSVEFVLSQAIKKLNEEEIKKSTGKSSFEHAINYAEKHNPDRKKVKCVQFLEATESEVCSILRKRMSELREKIDINSKIKIRQALSELTLNYKSYQVKISNIHKSST